MVVELEEAGSIRVIGNLLGDARQDGRIGADVAGVIEHHVGADPPYSPTEAVFDDNPRQNSLIIAVHMWNPEGVEPNSIWEVLHRHKDIQYSSRIATHISRQQQTHHMRRIVSELAASLPDDLRNSPRIRELAGYGCVTQMHVVRLLAPRLDNENHTKDVDLTTAGIRKRWDAGYLHTTRMLERTSRPPC